MNDTKKPTLHMCIGLPYSGFDEWAKRTGMPMVRLDSLRNVMHGQKFWKNAEPSVWSNAKLFVGSLFDAGHSDVVLVAPMWLRKHRSRWSDTRWDRTAIRFEADFFECQKRAVAAGNTGVIQVMQRMANSFDEPDAAYEDFLSVERVSMTNALRE